MIEKTYFVTFPRSGHHWLMNMLRAYFGDEMHYCERYHQPEKRMCVCPETNVEKDHDFGLDLDPKDTQVIVQYRRNVAAAIRSLHTALKPQTSLEQFAVDREHYWLHFTAKWVNENHYVVYYCDLLSNPVATVADVIRRLNPESEIDRERLIAVVRNNLSWPRIGIG